MTGTDHPLEQAISLHQAGHLDQAEALYRGILAAEPGHSEALHFLGLAAYQRGDHERAVELMTEAIARNGDEAGFHSNLGLALVALGRLPEAAAAYRRALQLQPDVSFTHFNLGNLLFAQGSYEEAAGELREALRLNPDYGDARWSLANLLLLTGNYEEGWPAFEARRTAANLAEEKLAKLLPKDVHILGCRAYDKPRWQGEDLQGKRLLVHFEYGFGDTIQFVRYIPLLAARGATVILEAQEPLRPLIEPLEGVHQFVASGAALPEHDLHCPLLSLPLYFRTTPVTIPARVPYLSPSNERVQQWRRRLGPRKAFRVALAWAVNPYPLYDGLRSMSLEQICTLGDVKGIEFYGLQKREPGERAPAAPSHLDWTDLGAEIRDFADTAAILKNMDLLIAIDSAPAHMGGAVGIPVWLLLPHFPDWRWMLDREDSLWYPTMRLFRQSRPGDWDELLARVRSELQRTADETAPRRGPAWLRRLGR